MKAQIPDALKADLPPTPWGKVLTVTPVVLTVIATLLAGLASSEMTRAQYDRGLAAQLQAKAGDQWSFFQAKRLRGTMHELVESVLAARPAAEEWGRVLSALPSAESATPGALSDQSFADLLKAAAHGRVASPLHPLPETIKAAQLAVDEQATDAVMTARLHEVSHEVLDQELVALRSANRAFDARAGQDNGTWDRLEAAALSEGWGKEKLTALRQAKLAYESQRYSDEARLNQRVAQIYELKVRKVNLSAERHHLRSARFFYGMLAAQVAVIVSTLALAAKARNWLWSVAAFAAVVALGLAIYVHLYL